MMFMENPKYYMIRRIVDNALLCKNGKWAEFSCFGNVSWSYKTYKHKQRAQNKANRYNHSMNRVEVIGMDENSSLDSSNNVIQLRVE